MAKKRETVDTGPLLTSLQKHGWFRKINDTVQVGIPDIMGCYLGNSFGVEVKSISEVPENGMVPPKSGHTFSPVQVRELNNIEEHGGVGVGVIICGSIAILVLPEQIDSKGQTNWYDIKPCCKIHKKAGSWDLTNLFNLRRR